jgi:hypothetical protein
MKNLIINQLINASTTHGYNVIQYNQNGTKKQTTIGKGESKLRSRKGIKYELIGSDGSMALTPAMAENLLRNWGF